MGEELPSNLGEIILYQTEDGQTRIECRFEKGTLWLSQALMAELYQTTIPNINLHLRNIFAEGELNAPATIKEYLIVRREGRREVERPVLHYNLEAVLAVGYRIRSPRGVAFRQWATHRLKEYLVKGFTMDDERLKHPPGPGVPDYFDELLARIRDIRSSEQRMYLQIRNIFALAADYQASAPETQQFFQIIQNKLHWAATGHTAAEIISQRADATKPNMGLTAWKGSKVRRPDVTIAKNYLTKNEIEELNRLVTMYLDYAEDQARRRRVLYMRDWREKLDAFLQFNERDLLTHSGQITKEVADRLAGEQFNKFEIRRLEQENGAAEQAFEAAIKHLPKPEIKKKTD